MQLNQFIFELASGIVDELRRTPEGQALNHLLTPRRQRRTTKKNASAPESRVKPDPPQPEVLPPASTSIDLARAALLLARFSTVPADEILDNDKARVKAFRDAVKKTHPDRGGDAAEFQQVMWAKEVLSIV